MKIFRSIALSIMAIMLVVQSRPSQAAVGVVFAAPVAVVAGLVVAGGAVGLQTAITIADYSSGSPSNQGIVSLIFLFVTVPAALLGIFILEGEQEMRFAPLSVAEAKKLKISSQELMAYNQELDQLNNLAAFVDETVMEDGKASVEESAALWSEVKHAVSPESFSALVKVNSQLFNR